MLILWCACSDHLPTTTRESTGWEEREENAEGLWSQVYKLTRFDQSIRSSSQSKDLNNKDLYGWL